PSTEVLETASEFALQDLGDGRAIAVGEYIVIEEEANPVVRTLKEHGYNVTALHNHMLDEEPRLLFVHFWRIGEAGELARGARAALERTNARLGSSRSAGPWNPATCETPRTAGLNPEQSPPGTACPATARLRRFLLRISLLSFGGPNAHLALTLDEVVNRAGSWSLDAVLLGRT